MALEREILAGNGITFSRQVMEPWRMEETMGCHARKLAERLLDFHRFAPQETVERLWEEQHRSRHLQRHANDKRRDAAQFKKRAGRESENLQAKAIRALEAAKNIQMPIESRWIELVKNTLFSEVIHQARESEGVNAPTAADLTRSLRVEGDGLVWTASQKVLAETTRSTRPRLQRPKPDLFISFPIIEDSTVRERVRNACGVKGFLMSHLELLEERGVVSNPLKFLRGKPLELKHRLCFPCFILEAKHHNVNESEIMKMYCQAANGAANALALLHTLTAKGIPSSSIEDIRPVVAFTLLGYQTRVWIAAIQSRKRVRERNCRNQIHREFTEVKYHMQCIWKGDLRQYEPMAELVCITESLKNWIFRDFRPWVSRCLNSHHCEHSSDSESSEEAEDVWEEEEEEEEVGTDIDRDSEDEQEWDEEYYVTLSDEEEEESEEYSDDEDLSEYERDLDRADSLLQELQLNDSATKKRVPHRFIQSHRERDF
ncbi:hypothetical protein BDV26DRAFT_17026 [Aspergillus bertholletiae]|uniref:Uncharacterized protein n=1 Tax=Aspergillus bertholletiae TaxID=1226010 RepID=A0A5N7BKP7_9EURO|nr:hypothetical protein BDV26DRAFT_17026 [Aspergillus bertholletiae]